MELFKHIAPMAYMTEEVKPLFNSSIALLGQLTVTKPETEMSISKADSLLHELKMEKKPVRKLRFVCFKDVVLVYRVTSMGLLKEEERLDYSDLHVVYHQPNYPLLLVVGVCVVKRNLAYWLILRCKSLADYNLLCFTLKSGVLSQASSSSTAEANMLRSTVRPETRDSAQQRQSFWASFGNDRLEPQTLANGAASLQSSGSLIRPSISDPIQPTVNLSASSPVHLSNEAGLNEWAGLNEVRIRTKNTTARLAAGSADIGAFGRLSEAAGTASILDLETSPIVASPQPLIRASQPPSLDSLGRFAGFLIFQQHRVTLQAQLVVEMDNKLNRADVEQLVLEHQNTKPLGVYDLVCTDTSVILYLSKLPAPVLSRPVNSAEKAHLQTPNQFLRYRAIQEIFMFSIAPCMMAIKVGRKNAQTSLKIIRFPDDLRLTNVAHLILRARSEPNCVLPREAITRVTPGGEGDFDIDEVAFDEEMDIALQEIDSSNLNLDYI